MKDKNHTFMMFAALGLLGVSVYFSIFFTSAIQSANPHTVVLGENFSEGLSATVWVDTEDGVKGYSDIPFEKFMNMHDFLEYTENNRSFNFSSVRDLESLKRTIVSVNGKKASRGERWEIKVNGDSVSLDNYVVRDGDSITLKLL